MRVAIFGSEGQLGCDVCAWFDGHDVVTIPHSRADIADDEVVHRVVGATQPDWVINCAAMTDVDRCESDTVPAFQVNAVAARNSVPLREIDPAEWIEEWVDENGDLQELHIVREDDEHAEDRGFRVFKTIADDGDVLYKQIGFLGVDPDTAEISSVEVDESGLATVRVLASDGAEAVMELDTRRQAPREAGAVSITIRGEKGAAEVDLRKPNNSDQ